MEFLKHALDFFLHLDRHLSEIIAQYGTWTYAILAGIVFENTGSGLRETKRASACAKNAGIRSTG